MRGTIVTLTLLALAALALPGAAGAQILPTGNSGADQYQESIPAAGGNQASSQKPSGTRKQKQSGTGTGSGPGTGAVKGKPGTDVPNQASPGTAITKQALDKLGPDGKRTADTAAETAPSLRRSGGSDFSGDSGSDMGWVLPLILALTLAGALTFAVVRRRKGIPPPGRDAS